MSSARHSRPWVLLASLVVGAGLIAWLALGRAKLEAHGSTPFAAETVEPTSALVDIAPVTSDAATPDRESAAASTATSAQDAADAPGAPSASVSADALTLRLRFVRPDHSELQVTSARVELRKDGAVARSIDVVRASSAIVEGLSPGLYAIRVDALDFAHREQSLELRADDPRPDKAGPEIADERVVLWPRGWIAVVVKTEDGRPFTALATDWGFDPRTLFVGAFDVRTRALPPDSPRADHPHEPGLAQFRRPSTYKSCELPGSAVGALELAVDPPLWAGLYVYGQPHAWQLVQPARAEVVFELSSAALDALLARLTLRVVDAASRAPVAGAKVTLRADSSSHRRKDHGDVLSDDRGRVELVRIVPGRYEFAVARGESLHQEMISLGLGERRDLGDVAIGDGAGFEVLVVDAQGRPARAYVEIGPYAKEHRAGEIFPQMLRHRSGSDGLARLPLLSGSALVRATVEVGRSNDERYVQEVQGVRSANAVVDPTRVPTAPVRLVLMEPMDVHVATNRSGTARIEVLDELDVIVARASNRLEVDVELVPGNYRARLLAKDGTTLGESAIRVEREPLRVQID